MAQHDLGRALPERAMVVDRREPEVGVRKVLQLADRRVDARGAALHALEKLADSLGIHWVRQPTAGGLDRGYRRPARQDRRDRPIGGRWSLAGVPARIRRLGVRGRGRGE